MPAAERELLCLSTWPYILWAMREALWFYTGATLVFALADSFSLRMIFFSVAVRFSVKDWPLRCLLIALNKAFVDVALIRICCVEEEIAFDRDLEFLLVLLLSLVRLARFFLLSSLKGLC